MKAHVLQVLSGSELSWLQRLSQTDRLHVKFFSLPIVSVEESEIYAPPPSTCCLGPGTQENTLLGSL